MPIDNVIEGDPIETDWGNDVADTVNGLETSLAALLPSGVILPYGGTSAPTGYLLCDGTSYLRADHAALFAVIGTAYGSVDGTHFNVPDLRQRFPLGKAASGTGVTMGSSGGAIDHTHTGAAHTHTGAAHTHTGAGHTHTGPSHAHELPMAAGSTSTQRFIQGSAFGTGGSFTYTEEVATSSISATANHMLSNTEGTGATGSTTPGAGGSTTPGAGGSTTPGAGGTANAPYQVVQYIIRD